MAINPFCGCRFSRSIILGRHRESPFEHRLAILGCFTVATIMAIAAVINWEIGLYKMAELTAVFSAIGYVCFAIARMGHYHQRIIQFISLLSVVFYNLGWYWSYGFQGPAIALIIGVFIFFMLIWQEKYMFYLFLLMVGNMSLLFVIEYFFRDYLPDRGSLEIRVPNLYAGSLLTMLVIFALVNYIKRNYIREYEKAKHADELKAAFLANLSHEIRTPLNVISGFTTMLGEEGYSRSELNEIQKVIDLNGKMLLNLLEDIVDFSKLNVDDFEIIKKETNLPEMFEEIREYIELIVLEGGGWGVQLRLDLQYQNELQNMDKKRVKQVLRLLITNAFRHTENGEVIAGVKEEEEQLLFWVKDTGSGIKPEDQPKVFESFVKGTEEAGSLSRGVGIGLSLSKRLVEKMGGMIWFTSEYGQGTDFYFTVPKKRPSRLDFNGKIVCD